MKNLVYIFFLLSFKIAAASSLITGENAQAPVAKEIPHQLEKFGDVRTDNYFWLKDRENPQVIDYLKSENSYFEKVFAPAEKLKKEIFNEIRSRTKEDDSSYPAEHGDFLYYRRYEKGLEYPIYARKKKKDLKKEEVLFDLNKLAKGHSYFSAHYKMSPSHRIAAFSSDTVGRRFYTIKFKDLATNRFLPGEIKNVTESMAWANDNESFFYTKQDPETLRHFQVYRYNIKNKKSQLIFEEKDETFEVYFNETLLNKHLLIESYSTLSREVRAISKDNPQSEAFVVLPREKKHEFSIDEDENYFYVLSNKNARNFKVFRFKQDQKSEITEELIIPHSETRHIDDLMVFKNQLVISSRENGLMQLEIYDKADFKNPHKLTFNDSAYTAEFGENYEYNSSYFRYEYESLRQPPSVYDYDFSKKESVLRKTKEIPQFNAELYTSERFFIKSRDGEKIPVSVLMKKTTPLDGTAPSLIYAYGSYGSNMDPWFSSSVMSLVNRGFIYVIAHVRGGGEMGRRWTDDGRTLKKKNTFLDFIDVTEGMIQKKYISRDKIFAMGGSAGGLLMGVIVNYRPELYKGVIAEVPFVDVLTTMLDDSIPLTTSEYDEWGNPNEKIFYDYIKSYSPYDNVKKQNFPHLLVTTGLHDSQVQYWEPAKWVAKIRKHNTGKNIVLLKTDMDSGHGGKSGRFEQIDEIAMVYAFILGLL